MKKDAYEVRGLKFAVRTTDIELVHLCTFSISLRLPTNSYWVAYFKWQSGSGDISAKMREFGQDKTVATGAGVLPSVIMAEAGGTPHDLIELGLHESHNATLHYRRTKEETLSFIKIEFDGRIHRTLKFHLAELSKPSADETTAMRGVVGLWSVDGRQQSIKRHPNASPPHSAFNPHAP